MGISNLLLRIIIFTIVILLHLAAVGQVRISGTIYERSARFGMAGVQRTPFLKRFFMDEARGMSGKLPELLRG